MALDLTQVKNKLAQMQPKQKFEKIDYSKIYWKPKVGKQVIRIVPSAFNENKYSFKEIYLHYNIGKGPIMALTNWNEIDPIVEFANSLRKSSDKDDWQLANKLSPKQRIVVPVIVRGEEAQGVRLWEIGSTLYKQLLNIAGDEDYGDYTDLVSGRDFTVEGVKDLMQGREYVRVTLLIKPKESALSSKPEEVEKWLAEQPDIMTVYRKYDFETLKGMLQKFLEPEETVEEVVHEGVDEPKSDLPFDQEEKSMVKNAPVKNVESADKFDVLFQTEGGN